MKEVSFREVVSEHQYLFCPVFFKQSKESDINEFVTFPLGTQFIFAKERFYEKARKYYKQNRLNKFSSLNRQPYNGFFYDYSDGHIYKLNGEAEEKSNLIFYPPFHMAYGLECLAKEEYEQENASCYSIFGFHMNDTDYGYIVLGLDDKFKEKIVQMKIMEEL